MVNDMLPKLFPQKVSAENKVWTKYIAQARSNVLTEYDCAAYGILKGDYKIDFIFYDGTDCYLGDFNFNATATDLSKMDLLHVYRCKTIFIKKLITF